jgi:signal transduction histidine kinase
VQIAYKPISDATRTFLVALLTVIALAIISAVPVGNNLVSPIIGITKATSKMTNGGDYSRYLPLDRKDELGDLARSFDQMSRRIINGKNKLMDERDRAELYVDIMGHDINNLNQTALLNMELLADDKSLTDQQRELIESSLRSVMGSAEIIENVRTIQKINSGELTIEPEDVDAMIQECIKRAPRPEGRRIIIRFEPGHGRVVYGPPLLKEIFCNLINNAIVHSEGDVEVDIGVNEREADGKKYYDIAIADNGPGIPDEIKVKLFKRFQRGATKAHGKGLGLYITKMLAEHSGGSIRIEDRVPGDHTKGAKFVVTLPAARSDRHG